VFVDHGQQLIALATVGVDGAAHDDLIVDEIIGVKLYPQFVASVVKLPAPAEVELAGHAGFDAVILDTEHGPDSGKLSSITCALPMPPGSRFSSGCRALTRRRSWPPWTAAPSASWYPT
jgi:hypothetical protein